MGRHSILETKESTLVTLWSKVLTVEVNAEKKGD